MRRKPNRKAIFDLLIQTRESRGDGQAGKVAMRVATDDDGLLLMNADGT